MSLRTGLLLICPVLGRSCGAQMTVPWDVVVGATDLHTLICATVRKSESLIMFG